MKRSGVTLLEILTVIFIVGMLITLAIANFARNKESDYDTEAEGCLRQLNAAERLYYLKNGSYYSSGVISDLNDNLKLDLPTGSSRLWNYSSDSSGCVQAIRNGGSRTWRMMIDEDDPVAGATCS